ncbi:MAG: hypothetical protein K9J85_02635 [Desulfobacteraceae bacterium]|nr:hypothetical protein [Desulfobacteraceae bacterium]
MHIKKCIITCIIGLTLFSSAACTNNGIEGRLEPYGVDLKEGIQVIAETRTNIKEDLSKAKKITTCDQNGVFTFKNLIPGKGYRIRVSGSRYISGSIYAPAPEKGTHIAKNPLKYTAIPPGKGIWFYDPGNSKFENVAQNNDVVKIRSHSGLGGNAGLGRSNLSAFSIAPRDTRNPFTVSSEGYIFVLEEKLKDFAKLGKITKPGIPEITDGYYYNIRDFQGKELKAVFDKPNITNQLSIKHKGRNLYAFSLDGLSRGLYVIPTKIERQNMGRILGGEPAPREGYVLFLTEGEEYNAHLLLKSKKYKDSIQIFSRLHKNNPDDTFILKGLFSACCNAGDTEKAIEAGVELDSLASTSDLNLKIGKLYQENGNKEKAVHYLKRSLGLDFSNKSAKNSLSDLLNKPIKEIIENDKELKVGQYSSFFNQGNGVPVPLKPGKVCARVLFLKNKYYKLKPENRSEFIVVGAESAKEFKIPPDWKAIGGKEDDSIGIFKGGNTEQVIFLGDINLLNIELSDQDYQEFLWEKIEQRHGPGVMIKLLPGKISARVNFHADVYYKLLPRDRITFSVINEKTKKEFEIPSEWKNIGNKEDSIALFKGGKLPQYIYLGGADKTDVEFLATE